MIEQIPDVAIALSTQMPNQLVALPAFLREKAVVMRMVAQESRVSFVDSWHRLQQKRRDNPGQARKGVGKGAVLATTNAAFLYGDDVLLYTAYDKGREAIPGVIPTRAGEVALAATVGLASAGFNRFLARKNQQSFTIARSQEVDTAPRPSGLFDRLKQRVEQTRDQLGSLAVSLGFGVPANAATKHLTERQVNVHSAVYGATAAAFYAGVSGVGALDNPWVYGGTLAAVVGNRVAGHVLEGVGQRAESRGAVDSVALPTIPPAEVHFTHDQIQVATG